MHLIIIFRCKKYSEIRSISFLNKKSVLNNVHLFYENYYKKNNEICFINYIFNDKYLFIE